jgi:phosphatidylglycerol---prolipoprotein diacylglyceryl transferase
LEERTLHFPFYVWVGPIALHPHWVFEVLSYFVGGRIYFWLRHRQGDPIHPDDRWWIVAAAAVGAAIGGKLLYWASDPGLTLEHATDPFFLMGGKSIVGALVGGLLAVEWTKGRLSVTRSTGDLFAIPLCIGIGVGRIGCFLTGLADHTHGLPASLLWAVDYGDGILRHPAQLYEIAFVWTLAAFLAWWSRGNRREGDVFKLFMVSYLGFRFLLEFLKPGVPIAGLNAIQWACLATLLYYGWTERRVLLQKEVIAHG